MIYDKNELRKNMKKMRSSLSKDDAAAMSRSIFDKITSLDEYRSAECVCVYISAFNEPRTIPVIERSIADGKRVCVPITHLDTNTLSLSYVRDLSVLQIGTFGIYEPTVIEEAQPSNVDFLLVPGLAFDKCGNRIGFGKGFYDRLLAQTSAPKAGVCYEFQVMDKLNPEVHDIPMDMIITEKAVRICK